ncbi:hypothetical protein BTO01_29140 [Vibrio jasicida]|uniref:AMP-binding protein n=1 Tax=Vibrio jasicida TaxID=766224 RepID=UPI000D4AC2B6|nr:AMP-binding protein [Vibrio jasicida]PQJ44592.1 hypothetical protein BTO01_29140 [Vibrio jasicida]
MNLLTKLYYHCQLQPDYPALIDENHALSYGELEKHILELSQQLRSENLGKGQLVAIYMPRSLESIVALLSVMNSGGAYTFIDYTEAVDYDLSRLKEISPQHIITSDEGARRLAGLAYSHTCWPVPVPQTIQEPIRAKPANEDIAYVLYTSGSTGTPKGVMVTQQNCTHYVTGLMTRLSFTEQLSWAHVSTLSADLGNTAIFAALWSGGCLHLISDEIRRDPQGFCRYLTQHRIDVLKITPSHWRVMSASLHRPTEHPLLRCLILGGEALSTELARHVFNAGHCKVLVNHYGPTEATVGVSALVLNSVNELAGFGSYLPVGKPLGQTRFLICDEQGNQLLPGEEGELLIGGPSVALGYRNDQQKTAAVFLLRPEGRFYRSADRFCVDSDGNYHFLGRSDRQLKVNGYRIEPGQIEQGLCSLPSVKGARVMLLSVGGRSQLVAALVQPQCNDDSARLLDNHEASKLRESLNSMLPAWMIPARFIQLATFPLNTNGKADYKLLEKMISRKLAGMLSPLADQIIDSSQIAQTVASIWQRYLPDVYFQPDTDFFAAGGNSIDAIQMISDLQVQGFSITAMAFLQEPVMGALINLLSSPIAAGVLSDNPTPKKTTEFVTSQRWFLSQRFADPDNWAQAVLLQSRKGFQRKSLKRALSDVLEAHPMLGARIDMERSRWQGEMLAETVDRVFSEEPRDFSISLEQQLQHATAARCEGFRLADGRVFSVHLIYGDQKGDQLLLLAHHMVVDAVSWRIITDDLLRLYKADLNGEPLSLPRSKHHFWEWSKHLNSQRESLRPDLAYWPAPPAQLASLPYLGNSPQDNLEAQAWTYWVAFTHEQSEAILTHLCHQAKVTPQSLFLGALACAIGGQDPLWVEVESHGRVSLEPDLDIARMVGWFTSIWPLAIHPHDQLSQTAHDIHLQMSRIPHQGVAWDLLSDMREIVPAEICYNYLGEFQLRRDEDQDIAFSRLNCGPVRGGRNNRGHDIKVTVRQIGGQFVVDFSSSCRRLSLEYMTTLSDRFSQLLLALLPSVQLQEIKPAYFAEQGSRTGLLTYVPAELALSTVNAPIAAETQRHILLTGATGFIGCHVLYQLLKQTKSKIYCLVRKRSTQSAEQRLHAAWQHYFASDDLEAFVDRVIVLTGDVSEPELGLNSVQYDALSHQIDALYHFAADIRLFGEWETYLSQIVRPVQMLIEFSRQGKNKALHYMSTLAVSGINSSQEITRFHEGTLEADQKFQNNYERAKFESEKLMQQFIAVGGRGYIYRSGNVTADSVDGIFQRNAEDNRFVQFLRGVMACGKLPARMEQRIVLSPVDVVAQGIIAISTNPMLDHGTFHVESEYEIAYQDIFACLERVGYCCERVLYADSFEPLLADNNRDDPKVALALFWSRRPERRYRFDHQRTQRLLKQNGVTFPVLDVAWLTRFIDKLIAHGVFV